MFLERTQTAAPVAASERREDQQPQARVLGHVVQCDGARAVIAAFAEPGDNTVNRLWTVGRLISVNLGASRIVGLVYGIGKSDRTWSETGQNPIEVLVELAGEVRDTRSGACPCSTAASPSIPISAPSRTASGPATCRRSTISPVGRQSPSAR